ncbi:MAG: hypothetical protein LC114_01930 [Bryobacterales bacterium]|nr:hypothetical protein [Bryobacterales bacterium]
MCALLSWFSQSALHAQKPLPEEKPQVLQLAPEAPDFVKAETARLAYLPLPLERNGLLSQQVEESMKKLRSQLGKRKLLRITAWVGGAGDTRRVSSDIRELLTKWKIPIPAIVVARVGSLPDRAARVAFDVEIEDNKPVNPHGLIFLAGVRFVASEFHFDVSQEVEKAADVLANRLGEERVGPDNVLITRCFVSLTENLAELEHALRKRFPKSQIRVVQGLRSSPDSYATCNLTARLADPPALSLEAHVATLDENSPPVTTLTKTNAPTLVLTSAQLGFRSSDADLALAAERLQSSLKTAGSSLAYALQLNILAENLDLAQRAESQSRRYFDEGHDPAIFRAAVEALPALDSTLSLDATAIAP